MCSRRARARQRVNSCARADAASRTRAPRAPLAPTPRRLHGPHARSQPHTSYTLPARARRGAVRCRMSATAAARNPLGASATRAAPPPPHRPAIALHAAADDVDDTHLDLGDVSACATELHAFYVSNGEASARTVALRASPELTPRVVFQLENANAGVSPEDHNWLFHEVGVVSQVRVPPLARQRVVLQLRAHAKPSTTPGGEAADCGTGGGSDAAAAAGGSAPLRRYAFRPIRGFVTATVLQSGVADTDPARNHADDNDDDGGGGNNNSSDTGAARGDPVATLAVTGRECFSELQLSSARLELSAARTPDDRLSAVKDIAVWNSAEVGTTFRLRVHPDDGGVSCTDYESGASLASVEHVRGLRRRTLRLLFAARDAGIYRYTVECVNLRNLSNRPCAQLRVRADVTEPDDVLSVVCPSGVVDDDAPGDASGANVLAFGDVYLGSSARREVKLINTSSNERIEVSLVPTAASLLMTSVTLAPGEHRAVGVTYSTSRLAERRSPSDRQAVRGGGLVEQHFDLVLRYSRTKSLARPHPSPWSDHASAGDGTSGANDDTGSDADDASRIDGDSDDDGEVGGSEVGGGRGRGTNYERSRHDQAEPWDRQMEERDEQEGEGDEEAMAREVGAGEDEGQRQQQQQQQQQQREQHHSEQPRHHIAHASSSPSSRSSRLSSSSPRHANTITIPCRARVCESLVQVSPREIDLGDCYLESSYSTYVQLSNLSALPAMIGVHFSSTSVTVPSEDVIIGAYQSYDLRIDFTPHRVIPAYAKQLTLANLRNKQNENVVVLRANCVDRFRVLYHAPFYTLTTMKRSQQVNELSFGTVVAGHPYVRAFRVRNVTDRPLVLAFEVPKRMVQLLVRNYGSGGGSGAGSTNDVATLPIRGASHRKSHRRQRAQQGECSGTRRNNADMDDPCGVGGGGSGNAVDADGHRGGRGRDGADSVPGDGTGNGARADDLDESDESDHSTDRADDDDPDALLRALPATPTFFSGSEAEAEYIDATLSHARALQRLCALDVLRSAERITIEGDGEAMVYAVLCVDAGRRRLRTKLRPVEEKICIRLIEYDATRLPSAGEQSVPAPEPAAPSELPPRELLALGRACVSRMELAQSHINFGHIIAGEQRAKTLLVQNLSEVHLLYAIRKSGSVASGYLHFGSDRVGVLRPFSAKEIPFVFRPSLHGVFEEAVRVENMLDASERHAVTMKASVHKPTNFIVRPQLLDLGSIEAGAESAPAVFCVENQSERRRSFTIEVAAVAPHCDENGDGATGATRAHDNGGEPSSPSLSSRVSPTQTHMHVVVGTAKNRASQQRQQSEQDGGGGGGGDGSTATVASGAGGAAATGDIDMLEQKLKNAERKGKADKAARLREQIARLRGDDAVDGGANGHRGTGMSARQVANGVSCESTAVAAAADRHERDDGRVAGADADAADGASARTRVQADAAGADAGGCSSSSTAMMRFSSVVAQSPPVPSSSPASSLPSSASSPTSSLSLSSSSSPSSSPPAVTARGPPHAESRAGRVSFSLQAGDEARVSLSVRPPIEARAKHTLALNVFEAKNRDVQRRVDCAFDASAPPVPQGASATLRSVGGGERSRSAGFAADGERDTTSVENDGTEDSGDDAALVVSHARSAVGEGSGARGNGAPTPTEATAGARASTEVGSIGGGRRSAGGDEATSCALPVPDPSLDAVCLSSSSVDFGKVMIGLPAEQRVMLRNTSAQRVRFSVLDNTNAALPATMIWSPEKGSVAPYSSAALNILFRPVRLARVSRTLSIRTALVDDDGDGGDAEGESATGERTVAAPSPLLRPFRLHVSGVGVARPSVRVLDVDDSSSWDCGYVYVDPTNPFGNVRCLRLTSVTTLPLLLTFRSNLSKQVRFFADSSCETPAGSMRLDPGADACVYVCLAPRFSEREMWSGAARSIAGGIHIVASAWRGDGSAAAPALATTETVEELTVKFRAHAGIVEPQLALPHWLPCLFGASGVVRVRNHSNALPLKLRFRASFERDGGGDDDDESDTDDNGNGARRGEQPLTLSHGRATVTPRGAITVHYVWHARQPGLHSALVHVVNECYTSRAFDRKVRLVTFVDPGVVRVRLLDEHTRICYVCLIGEGDDDAGAHAPRNGPARDDRGRSDNVPALSKVTGRDSDSDSTCGDSNDDGDTLARGARWHDAFAPLSAAVAGMERGEISLSLSPLDAKRQAIVQQLTPHTDSLFVQVDDACPTRFRTVCPSDGFDQHELAALERGELIWRDALITYRLASVSPSPGNDGTDADANANVVACAQVSVPFGAARVHAVEDAVNVGTVGYCDGNAPVPFAVQVRNASEAPALVDVDASELPAGVRLAESSGVVRLQRRGETATVRFVLDPTALSKDGSVVAGRFRLAGTLRNVLNERAPVQFAVHGEVTVPPLVLNGGNRVALDDDIVLPGTRRARGAWSVRARHARGAAAPHGSAPKPPLSPTATDAARAAARNTDVRVEWRVKIVRADVLASVELQDKSSGAALRALTLGAGEHSDMRLLCTVRDDVRRDALSDTDGDALEIVAVVELLVRSVAENSAGALVSSDSHALHSTLAPSAERVPIWARLRRGPAVRCEPAQLAITDERPHALTLVNLWPHDAVHIDAVVRTRDAEPDGDDVALRVEPSRVHLCAGESAELTLRAHRMRHTGRERMRTEHDASVSLSDGTCVPVQLRMPPLHRDDDAWTAPDMGATSAAGTRHGREAGDGGATLDVAASGRDCTSVYARALAAPPASVPLRADGEIDGGDGGGGGDTAAAATPISASTPPVADDAVAVERRRQLRPADGEPTLCLRGCASGAGCGQYDIDAGQVTVGSEPIEWRVVVESLHPSAPVEYKVYRASGAATWLTLDRSGGIVESARGTQPLTFRLHPTDVGLRQDFVFLEDRNAPAQLVCVRIVMEVVASTADAAEMFTVLCERIDYGTVTLGHVYQHKSMVVRNHTQAPLEFLLRHDMADDARSELSFSTSNVALRKVSSLWVPPARSRRIYLYFRPERERSDALPTTAAATTTDSTVEAGAPHTPRDRATAPRTQAVERAFNVLVSCRLVRDHLTRICVHSLCLPPRIVVSTKDVAFTLGANGELMPSTEQCVEVRAAPPAVAGDAAADDWRGARATANGAGGTSGKASERDSADGSRRARRLRRVRRRRRLARDTVRHEVRSSAVFFDVESEMCERSDCADATGAGGSGARENANDGTRDDGTDDDVEADDDHDICDADDSRHEDDADGVEDANHLEDDNVDERAGAFLGRIRVRPRLGAVRNLAPNERYIDEHCSIYNRARPREFFWVRLRLKIGRGTADEFSAAPLQRVHALETLVTRFLRQFAQFWAPLRRRRVPGAGVDSMMLAASAGSSASAEIVDKIHEKQRAALRDDPLDAWVERVAAAVTAADAHSNDAANARAASSSYSSTDEATKKMVAAEDSTAVADWRQRGPIAALLAPSSSCVAPRHSTYDALLFEAHVCTDELIFYALKDHSGAVLRLADTCYTIVFKSDVFRVYAASGGRAARDRTIDVRAALEPVVRPWIGQLRHFLSFFPDEIGGELRGLRDTLDRMCGTDSKRPA